MNKLELEVLGSYRYYTCKVMLEHPDEYVRHSAKLILEQGGTAGGKHIMKNEIINFLLY